MYMFDPILFDSIKLTKHALILLIQIYRWQFRETDYLLFFLSNQRSMYNVYTRYTCLIRYNLILLVRPITGDAAKPNKDYLSLFKSPIFLVHIARNNSTKNDIILLVAWFEYINDHPFPSRRMMSTRIEIGRLMLAIRRTKER